MTVTKKELTALKKEFKSLEKKMEKLLKAAESAAKPKKASKAKVAKAKPAKKAPAKKAVASGKETVLDTVIGVIGKSKDGADIASLKSKTGLESRQLSNALYKLTKKGLIKAKSRGVYIKA